METVKNQVLLVRAFLRALTLSETARDRLRLVLIGEGSLRDECLRLLRTAKVEHVTWVPGTREEVPEILRNMDLFVLPSLAEGISNTILEAMASGLPVVATRVGGNPELVQDGITGTLTESQHVEGMARALASYASNPSLARQQGSAGRRRAEQRFSLDAMVAGYLRTYDRALGLCNGDLLANPAISGSAVGPHHAKNIVEIGGTH
jgi:glycosyltransferase involved in cell wall biosynthesis